MSFFTSKENDRRCRKLAGRSKGRERGCGRLAKHKNVEAATTSTLLWEMQSMRTVLADPITILDFAASTPAASSLA